jgi:hypothetical protein
MTRTPSSARRSSARVKYWAAAEGEVDRVAQDEADAELAKISVSRAALRRRSRR